jgi:hypothetical protein
MRRHDALVSAMFALLVGCAGHTTMPSVPVSSAQSITSHDIFWGLGVSGFISAEVPHGLGARMYEKTFCQVKKSCPIFSLGVRSYHTSLHHTLNWSGGSFSASAAPSATLGVETFHQTVSTDSSSDHISQAVESSTKFAWVDLLSVTSSTLPAGTPVTLKVTTALKPGTIKAPCNADSVPSANFYFQSNGFRNGYSQIYGSCVKKKFIFYIDTPAKKGTVLTEQFYSVVGENVNIGGMGSVINGLCAVVGCIPQSSTLEGTVKYTIVPVTKGASFKSASGYNYQ